MYKIELYVFALTWSILHYSCLTIWNYFSQISIILKYLVLSIPLKFHLWEIKVGQYFKYRCLCLKNVFNPKSPRGLRKLSFIMSFLTFVDQLLYSKYTDEKKKEKYLMGLLFYKIIPLTYKHISLSFGLLLHRDKKQLHRQTYFSRCVSMIAVCFLELLCL